jgi:RNA polymerase-binding transcription factor
MIAMNYAQYQDRLKKRRTEIMMTLEHVQKEQREVDENKDCIDKAAYRSRVHLLGNLTDWYLKENTRIDDALIRIAEGKYGICLACHEPIEPQRLELTPAAAFCAECQKTREQLSANAA